MMDAPRESRQPRPSTAAWIGDKPAELWRFLRFLGCDSALAEDLVQETFLVAIEHGVPELAAHSAHAWLRTTARNLYVDQLRRAHRQREVRQVEQLELAWVEKPHPNADYLAALRQCLDFLGERERRALELRYGSARASRETIAAELGLKRGGVKALLHRARQRLKVCVQRRLGDD